MAMCEAEKPTPICPPMNIAARLAVQAPMSQPQAQLWRQVLPLQSADLPPTVIASAWSAAAPWECCVTPCAWECA